MNFLEAYDEMCGGNMTSNGQHIYRVMDGLLEYEAFKDNWRECECTFNLLSTYEWKIYDDRPKLKFLEATIVMMRGEICQFDGRMHTFKNGVLVYQRDDNWLGSSLTRDMLDGTWYEVKK